ncbi:MAG: leucine-rich repeat domain-containing protein [Eubacterium sp.]|nr:leucine-rich repeat domain-containing protein [Eubacterium sp.]
MIECRLKKQIISLLIGVVICLAFFLSRGADCHAADPLEKGTKIYTDSNAWHMVYQVTSAKKKSPKVKCLATYGWQENIKVPSTISYNGVKYKVTAIAANAFRGYSIARTITVGENVKKVGNNAFRNCNNLEQIRFLGRKIKAGKKIFSGAKELNMVKTKTHAVKKVMKKAVKSAGLSALVM